MVLGEKSGGGLPSAIIKFELKFKAMGGFPVCRQAGMSPMAFFISAYFLERLGSKKAMDSDHSLFCFRGE